MTSESSLSFRYFQAPEHEMVGLLPGRHRCALCGNEDRCFNLQRALGDLTGSGCAACLHEGRFGFFHITEVGYLDESGLTWYGQPPNQPQRIMVAGSEGVTIQTAAPISERAAQPVRGMPTDSHVAELRRTPSFPTWNEVEWRVHCDDFMVYLGPWAPRQVVALSTQLGLLPQECFSQLVGHEHRDLWTDGEDWAITLHVFRCIECAIHVGVADFS